MIPRAHTMKVAWLGLAAMCLIVFAPFVSQIMAAHSPVNTAAVLCSVTANDHELIGRSHAGSLSACGYCDLLADHTPLCAVPSVTLAFIALIGIAAVLLPAFRLLTLGAFPSGSPRAPPACA